MLCNKLPCPVPVSYTHLDVYKRQATLKEDIKNLKDDLSDAQTQAQNAQDEAAEARQNLKKAQQAAQNANDVLDYILSW